MNTCSLPKKFRNLQLLIQSKYIDFESSANSTLLSGRNRLSYKLRKDLSIWKSYEPETTSIEFKSPKND